MYKDVLQGAEKKCIEMKENHMAYTEKLESSGFFMKSFQCNYSAKNRIF